jgi:aminopeptidase C
LEAPTIVGFQVPRSESRQIGIAQAVGQVTSVTTFRVRIAKEAEEDLAELVDYIAQYDSVERANYVLERLLRSLQAILER